MKYNLHFLFTSNCNELFNNGYDLLDFIMSKHDRFKHHVFRNFISFSLYHHNGIFRTSHYDIDIAYFLLSKVRVNDKLTVYASDSYSTNRSVKRHIRNTKCSRSTDHCCNLRFTILIHTHNHVYDLYIVTKALWK
ncbi:hypothetical protein D3C81_1901490 [compost metagenome]